LNIIFVLLFVIYVFPSLSDSLLLDLRFIYVPADIPGLRSVMSTVQLT